MYGFCMAHLTGNYASTVRQLSFWKKLFIKRKNIFLGVFFEKNKKKRKIWGCVYGTRGTCGQVLKILPFILEKSYRTYEEKVIEHMSKILPYLWVKIHQSSKIKIEKIQKFQRRLKPVRASDVEIFTGENGEMVALLRRLVVCPRNFINKIWWVAAFYVWKFATT